MRRFGDPVRAALLILGTLAWLACLFADPLGLAGSEGYQWKQIVGAEVGLLAMGAGMVWPRLRRWAGSATDGAGSSG